MPNRWLGMSVSVGVVVAILFLLSVGKELLIPLAVAVMIWYLLNALTSLLRRYLPVGEKFPPWIFMTLSLVLVMIALSLVVNLVTSNVTAVTRAAPTYQANIQQLLERVTALLGLEETVSVKGLFDQFSLGEAVGGLARVVSSIAGRTGLILIYVIFLMFEQKSFHTKLDTLFPEPQRRSNVQRVIDGMQTKIQTYIWIKTLMSMLTGVLSYIVLRMVGVDFADFWAFTIFMLNFIPTIGSMIGVALPALLTLVQFPDTVMPFLVVVCGLGALQFAIGNILEPRLMGGSLNVSALVVILALALWGKLWGVTGMFLCVPITVIMMIVFAQFPGTRPIAILLSQQGSLEGMAPDDPPPTTPATEES